MDFGHINDNLSNILIDMLFEFTITLKLISFMSKAFI